MLEKSLHTIIAFAHDLGNIRVTQHGKCLGQKSITLSQRPAHTHTHTLDQLLYQEY